MFTGLVQDVGAVERVLPAGGMTQLWIRTALGAGSFSLGESIAVQGACLTVVEVRGETFRAEASEETLRRTTLGDLKVGSPVNLERAMTLQDRLGGHLVLGHVDATAAIVGEGREGGARLLELELPLPLSPFFIEKGSVTVDGVSLTVNALAPDGHAFSLALIPETQKRTTLGARKVGERVNLEADLIGKYVARLYQAHAQAGSSKATAGVTEATLRAAGFHGAGDAPGSPSGKGGG